MNCTVEFRAGSFTIKQDGIDICTATIWREEGAATTSFLSQETTERDIVDTKRNVVELLDKFINDYSAAKFEEVVYELRWPGRIVI
jgi:hypothetical protein